MMKTAASSNSGGLEIEHIAKADSGQKHAAFSVLAFSRNDSTQSDTIGAAFSFSDRLITCLLSCDGLWMMEMAETSILKPYIGRIENLLS